MLFLFDGVLLFRLQTDALLALLFQEPPRLTRLEPDDEPSFAVFAGKYRFFSLFFLQKECYSQAARATAASLAWLTPSFCTHIGLLRGANKAEAQVVAPVRRSVAAPVANGRVVGVDVPRTTPFDAVRTRRRAERVGFLSCAYTAIPVVTPFPHISAHVVYAKCIRCFQTFLMCTITCNSA